MAIVEAKPCTECGEPTEDNCRTCIVCWLGDLHERMRPTLASENMRRSPRREQIFRLVTKTHGHDCYLCGKGIDTSLNYPHPQSWTKDHVTPVDDGGTHGVENLRPAHNKCNRLKSSKVIETTMKSLEEVSDKSQFVWVGIPPNVTRPFTITIS